MRAAVPDAAASPWLARVIELRSRQPGASLYFVTDAGRREDRRQRRDRCPAAILDQHRPGAAGRPLHVGATRRARRRAHGAGARGGASRRRRACSSAATSARARSWSRVVRRSLILTVALMVALGLIAWIFVSRRVLKRIDSIAETSQRIVAGDLSGRLEVTGTGDEFDRLAESLNTMLDAHRAADARAEAGLRQHRARPEDAADAHAQPRRDARWRRGGASPTIARRCRRRSRRPTS